MTHLELNILECTVKWALGSITMNKASGGDGVSVEVFQIPFKCKTRNYKTPEENIGKTLSDMNHSRILYDPPPRILEIKAKINKWDLMKPKSFCTTKETISKVKRQPSGWEKIIANEERDKGLIPKLYK